MEDNEIKNFGVATMGSEQVEQFTVLLNGRQTFEFVIQDRTGNQPNIFMDVCHVNPTDRGAGIAEINWEVTLQWWEGFDGTKEWRKVGKIKNRSRDQQKVSLLLRSIS